MQVVEAGMIFVLLFLSGAAPQRLVARRSGENGVVLLALQWFGSHLQQPAPLCSWWPRALGTAGTGVTQGGQQPGLGFGRKAGLSTGCCQTFLLWLWLQTDLPPASEQPWIECKSKYCLGATSKNDKHLHSPWCKCPLQTWIFPFLLLTTYPAVWAAADCSLLSIWFHSSLAPLLPGRCGLLSLLTLKHGEGVSV